MSTKAMYDLRETLCTNLDQYARKGSLSRTDLETVQMLTDTIKNVDKISMMEEEGNSYGMGNWNANGSYSNGMRMSGRRSSRDGYQNDYSNEAYDMENRMRREMNY